MKKKDLRKPSSFILLTIFVLFLSMLACVLPSSGTLPTKMPTVENTQISLPTKMPTDDYEPNCEEMKSSGRFGIVVASPNGGLNVRDLPLESGGKIIETLSDGNQVEIFSTIGNNWNLVRFTDKNGRIVCGFVKMDYIQEQ